MCERRKGEIFRLQEQSFRRGIGSFLLFPISQSVTFEKDMVPVKESVIKHCTNLRYMHELIMQEMRKFLEK